MPQTRTDRTSYLGLLAHMIAAADTENWSYPYWNAKQIDAALAALADAPRDGTVPLVAPSAAPTAAISATSGTIAGSVTLEIGQTFVDTYGRETDVGPLATVATPAAITDPITAASLGTPTLGGPVGYEGGLLEVWYSWTDGSGGETLPSPPAQVDIPYQAGGLLSTVDVTLPSTPEVAGAAGANIYLRHRGGNVVLAYRILTGSVNEVTLQGAVADCYRGSPLVNSTGSVNAIDITGQAAPAGAARTRIYIRNAGDAWASADQRLKLNGVDDWDPATVTYPLIYTGASGELTAGYPPTVSQVKAIRPVDLSCEAIGAITGANLPPEAVTEIELARSVGTVLLGGLEVEQSEAVDMTVTVTAGEAIMPGGRAHYAAATTLAIPTADQYDDRIDIVCVSGPGVLEGPAENAALKGTPAGTPVAPATPAGYLKLAEVLVEKLATAIHTADITDCRPDPLPTLLAIYSELVADEGDLQAHTADVEIHSSHAFTMATLETSCAGSSSEQFTIPAMASRLVTELQAVAYSSGSLRYELYLYTNEGRTTLAYQAGDDAAENAITATAFTDRIPWEWFGGTTIYGTIINYSTDAISTLSLTLKYRK